MCLLSWQLEMLRQMLSLSFRGGAVLPIAKDGEGHRPLTLANVLRRAALRALVRQRRAQNAEAVGGIQYGVARKGGGDLMYKSIQARLAKCPGSMLLGTDF